MIAYLGFILVYALVMFFVLVVGLMLVTIITPKEEKE